MIPAFCGMWTCRKHCTSAGEPAVAFQFSSSRLPSVAHAGCAAIFPAISSEAECCYCLRFHSLKWHYFLSRLRCKNEFTVSASMKTLKAAIGLTLSLSTSAWAYIPPPQPDVVVSAPVSMLVWKEVPGSGGIFYANLKGDLLGFGPYEAFVRFPAGRNNPDHFHTQTLPTVVLEGTFYAIIDGKTVDYPPGSYYSLPAKLKHFSGCRPGADCLLYQHQAGKFDLVPVAP